MNPCLSKYFWSFSALSWFRKTKVVIAFAFKSLFLIKISICNLLQYLITNDERYLYRFCLAVKVSFMRISNALFKETIMEIAGVVGV